MEVPQEEGASGTTVGGVCVWEGCGGGPSQPPDWPGYFGKQETMETSEDHQAEAMLQGLLPGILLGWSLRGPLDGGPVLLRRFLEAEACDPSLGQLLGDCQPSHPHLCLDFSPLPPQKVFAGFLLFTSSPASGGGPKNYRTTAPANADLWA